MLLPEEEREASSCGQLCRSTLCVHSARPRFSSCTSLCVTPLLWLLLPPLVAEVVEEAEEEALEDEEANEEEDEEEEEAVALVEADVTDGQSNHRSASLSTLPS